MLRETGRLPSGLAVRPGVPWNDYSLQQFLLNVKAEKPPSDLKEKNVKFGIINKQKPH